MGDIYITSDFHFGHNKPFLYEPRGFETIWDHDRAIIKNWNKIIKPEDDVYILGDIMLNDNIHGIKCLVQLCGNIHIIRGNHDSEQRMELYKHCWNVVEVCEAKFLHYKKYHIFLSHFPTITSNFDYKKPLKSRCLNICGHSHTKNKWQDVDKGYIYHAELDAHDMKPVLLDSIITDFNIKFNS